MSPAWVSRDNQLQTHRLRSLHLRRSRAHIVWPPVVLQIVPPVEDFISRGDHRAVGRSMTRLGLRQAESEGHPPTRRRAAGTHSRRRPGRPLTATKAPPLVPRSTTNAWTRHGKPQATSPRRAPWVTSDRHPWAISDAAHHGYLVTPACQSENSRPVREARPDASSAGYAGATGAAPRTPASPQRSAPDTPTSPRAGS